MNEKATDAVAGDVPNAVEEKNFRDELAQTLKGARANPDSSSGGRAEAKGYLDYTARNDPRYDSAKEEHQKEIDKKTEARTLLVKKILNSNFRPFGKVLDEKLTFESLHALDTAVREGITMHADWPESFFDNIVKKLDRQEYDLRTLKDYVRSLCEKADRLYCYYTDVEKIKPKNKSEIGFDKYYAFPRNALTDYEKENKLTSDERKTKIEQLIEKFRIKK